MNGHHRQEDCIFALLLSLNKVVGPKFERCAGISPSRLRLLDELYRGEEISQIALQRILDIDAAAITRHLKGLEEGGMITRRNNPADNRVTLVCLTQQGREHIADYLQEKDRFINGLLTGFNEQDRAVLTDLLTRMQHNISQL
ncbi:MarR family winged helix-turn-helix transcriptional regulator [Paenibacillus sp. sgz500958]|uniref:MarR family winged helix-turn-helix transcriptional regulator n=1 Tax=Paenibacillus sp. sgz500958 TaxID=3242475 RepID=UPI0036D2E379